jgi:putative MFS transporter
LLTLAGILVFQAVVFLLFGFETKGRSLEEISYAPSTKPHGSILAAVPKSIDIGA